MVVESGRMVFFFGAGASAEFGIPLMRKMAEDFRSIVNEQGLSEQQDIYNEIVEMLKDDMRPDVDIEAIFSVIDGLQDYDIENIGELSIYISKKFFNDTPLRKNIASKTILQSLEKDFQRFIRRSCALKSPYRTKMENVFTGFFNTIGEAVNSPDGHSIKYDTMWTLFTTNYDRCLEAFWRENVRVELDTGFRDKRGLLSTDGTLHADNFLYSFGGELQFLRVGRPGRLRLVKLHGSTTWLIRKDTREIEEKQFDIDQGVELGTGSMYTDEVVMYPLRQKQLYVDPYIQMFFLLNKELQYNKVWIVVGYSFRDPIIQNIFSDNFKDGKKMILIHPNPEEVKKRFPDHEDDKYSVSYNVDIFV
jgi:SIR2-like domain